MSAILRGFRGKQAASFERKVDLPENIGNRKSFEEAKIPPDDVGNKLDNDPIASFVHDGLGNSLEDEPSHLRSGILSYLLGSKERGHVQKNKRERPSRADSSMAMRAPSSHGMSEPALKKPALLEPREIPKKILREDSFPKAPAKNNGEEYVAALVKEFATLFRERSGLPFSFAMKAISDTKIDEEAEQRNLLSLKVLIEGILIASDISASVAISEYRTNTHRFAVFFVNPSERDPVRNKDLISALRKVIKVHTSRYFSGQVNVLLVLANAEQVIEDHLYKLGAKKI